MLQFDGDRVTLAAMNRIALLATSIVLFGSFGCSAFGNFTGIVHFGILTFFATIVAFLSDVFVAPALMLVTESKDSQTRQHRAGCGVT